MKKNCKKTCNFCEPKQTPCDVSKTFGKLEGEHILKLNADGEWVLRQTQLESLNSL